MSSDTNTIRRLALTSAVSVLALIWAAMPATSADAAATPADAAAPLQTYAYSGVGSCVDGPGDGGVVVGLSRNKGPTCSRNVNLYSVDTYNLTTHAGYSSEFNGAAYFNDPAVFRNAMSVGSITNTTPDAAFVSAGFIRGKPTYGEIFSGTSSLFADGGYTQWNNSALPGECSAMTCNGSFDGGNAASLVVQMAGRYQVTAGVTAFADQADVTLAWNLQKNGNNACPIGTIYYGSMYNRERTFGSCLLSLAEGDVLSLSTYGSSQATLTIIEVRIVAHLLSN